MLSVIQRAATLSARPRPSGLRSTMMYDAITKLIKASSRNTLPGEEGGQRVEDSVHQPRLLP